MAKRQISEQQHRKIYHLYKGLYAIVIPSEQTITCVLIDPDEKMLDHMQQWMGMKMFRD